MVSLAREVRGAQFVPAPLRLFKLGAREGIRKGTTTMWRLWHKLFGWHYVVVSIAYDDRICRVYVDGDGRPYARRLSTHIDLKSTHRKWVPLTFPRAAIELSAPGADVIVMPRRAKK